MKLKELFLELLIKLGMFTAKSSCKPYCDKSEAPKSSDSACKSVAKEEKVEAKITKSAKTSAPKKAPLPRKKP